MTNILINQIGYDTKGSKQAVVQHFDPMTEPLAFEILYRSGQKVFESQSTTHGLVQGWKNRYFSVLDFTAFETQGTFKISITTRGQQITSANFRIGNNLIFETLSLPVFRYFNGMRSYIDDRIIPLIDQPDIKKDVCGGWDDASGDTGKYLSHLSYAHYFNPQHTPMVIWSILKSLDLCQNDFSAQQLEFTYEAAWGCDFLIRMFDQQGFFYTNVFDKWGTGDVREICAYSGYAGDKNNHYQAAFREGGGIAIAALAKAARLGISGTYSSTVYLSVAQKAFEHLAKKGAAYLSNNRANIIDHYCELLAAAELFKTTHDDIFKVCAKKQALALLALQTEEGYFVTETGSTRPFFHGVDEGLVLIALLAYLEIEDNTLTQQTIQQGIIRGVRFYLTLSNETFNPFNYIKQLAQQADPETGETIGEPQAGYFMPHQNETGYWWQGENARIASISTAIYLAIEQLGPQSTPQTAQLKTLANGTIDWILGQNPFDLCMICGFGHKDYPDLIGAASKFVRTNVEGGLCNGITAADPDESDICWMNNDDPETTEFNLARHWRWAEQWLPHNSWFLLALSARKAVADKFPA